MLRAARPAWRRGHAGGRPRGYHLCLFVELRLFEQPGAAECDVGARRLAASVTNLDLVENSSLLGRAGSLNVRFAPEATELLRRRELQRWDQVV